MTDKQLRACCREWQRILRLEDVDIDVRFIRKGELDGDCGRSSFTTDRTAVLIQVCPNSLVNPDAIGQTDEELTLVHELLHVQERIWAGTPAFRELLINNDTMRAAHEGSIERNAQALIALHRQIMR